MQQRRQAWDRLGGLFADAHTELRRKTHRAQHAHRIFAIAGFRIADQTDDAILQIFHAADVVADGEIRHAVVEAVDGKVAALGIFFNRTEDVVAQQHTVLAALGGDAIGGVAFMMAAEGGDFDNFRPEHHVRQAEAAAYQAAVAEQLTDLFRGRISGNVKIFRFFAQQQIAYAAADQPRFIARLVKSVHDLEGIFTDIFAGNCMLLARNNRHM